MIGLAATVLVTFYGQTRIFMRMSSDGMLPDRLGQVSERFETPTAATVVCAIAGAAVAALLPIDVLGDLVSIGTLLSFTIVCSGVLVLRRTRPDLERPFRVKGVWLVAPLGIVFAIALMATLPITTWIRLVVWLLIGLRHLLRSTPAAGPASGWSRLAADRGRRPGPRHLVAPAAWPVSGLRSARRSGEDGRRQPAAGSGGRERRQGRCGEGRPSGHGRVVGGDCGGAGRALRGRRLRPRAGSVYVSLGDSYTAAPLVLNQVGNRSTAPAPTTTTHRWSRSSSASPSTST